MHLFPTLVQCLLPEDVCLDDDLLEDVCPDGFPVLWKVHDPKLMVPPFALCLAMSEPLTPHASSIKSRL